MQDDPKEWRYSPEKNPLSVGCCELKQCPAEKSVITSQTRALSHGGCPLQHLHIASYCLTLLHNLELHCSIEGKSISCHASRVGSHQDHQGYIYFIFTFFSSSENQTYFQLWTSHVWCSLAKPKRTILWHWRRHGLWRHFLSFLKLFLQMPSDGYWAAGSTCNGFWMSVLTDSDLDPLGQCRWDFLGATTWFFWVYAWFFFLFNKPQDLLRNAKRLSCCVQPQQRCHAGSGLVCSSTILPRSNAVWVFCFSHQGLESVIT